jgi:hypothetical protein
MEAIGGTHSSAKAQAVLGLRNALLRFRPNASIDAYGYVGSFFDNILPLVSVDDFEADLRTGDGNELETKFRAAHSSSALAVNCFAPFRARLADLVMPVGKAFETLQFERKCPTGLRGGTAPNLDILLSGPTSVVGIESKLTEHLGVHRPRFSRAYAEQIRDERRNQGYFLEMLRLTETPSSYRWLDAAQLIKHAFGLARTFQHRQVTLLYLFWEPTNPEISPVFAEHREEIRAFSVRVSGSTPAFVAMSYPELWSGWRETAPAWLAGHLDDLAERYLIRL